MKTDDMCRLSASDVLVIDQEKTASEEYHSLSMPYLPTGPIERQIQFMTPHLLQTHQ
jgi:hypothetical protein